MKITQNLMPSLGLATVAIAAFSTSAQAISFTPLSIADTEFNALRADGSFTELFVAESRIGNNGTGGNGEREFGINTDTGLPVAAGHRNWGDGSGSPVDFILEYADNLVKYTVGGVVLSSTQFSGPVTDIFLRTKSVADSRTTTSTMSLTNLLLDGFGAISDLVSTGLDVDYLQISGLTGPFTLRGTSTMSWTGTAPNRSHLAYQIKVGTSPQQSVPEPSVVFSLLLGAGVFGTLSKKRRSQLG